MCANDGDCVPVALGVAAPLTLWVCDAVSVGEGLAVTVGVTLEDGVGACERVIERVPLDSPLPVDVPDTDPVFVDVPVTEGV